jgi:hypothetical protein
MTPSCIIIENFAKLTDTNFNLMYSCQYEQVKYQVLFLFINLYNYLYSCLFSNSHGKSWLYRHPMFLAVPNKALILQNRKWRDSYLRILLSQTYMWNIFFQYCNLLPGRVGFFLGVNGRIVKHCVCMIG